jgi:hypothetical protein
MRLIACAIVELNDTYTAFFVPYNKFYSCMTVSCSAKKNRPDYPGGFRFTRESPKLT